MHPPADRPRWLAWLERLARPVLETAAAGELATVLPQDVHPDAPARPAETTPLEAFGRTLAGIAPWLALAEVPADEIELQHELRALALTGLKRGCDPSDRGWLVFDRHQQTQVDAAFLVHGLLRGRTALWEPLGQDERQRVLDALALLRDRKPWPNNWLLFSGLVEAWRASVGADHDPMRIDYALMQHEQWYAGDGVYGDGPRFHADHYNAYVIHPMLTDMLDAVADADQRWTAMRERHLPRFMRFAAIQERLIAPDGSWPPLGRSLVYRCGAFQALCQAALQHRLPAQLHPAQVRAALSAAIERSLAPADSWRNDGWLAIGLTGHQPSLGEAYITTGSLYLACTVLLPLGLPATDPFWSAPARPWTARLLWDQAADLPADHALRD